MGAADVVPGVSGGTMAFILGIYEELIGSIQTFASKEFWANIVKGRIVEALRSANIGFLVCVFLGIMTAIFTLAHTLEKLLETHPAFVWSFFFGLILASVFVISKRVEKWSPKELITLIVATALAYLIVGLVPVETPNAWWFLILAGAIAICAMILPGISGAFLLLLLGEYQTALAAVNDRDFATLALFAIGAVVGLVLFSKVLNWLFRSYHNLTVVFLMGLMIGSLRKIWPWGGGGEIEIWAGIGLIAAGIAVVLVIELCTTKRSGKRKVESGK